MLQCPDFHPIYNPMVTKSKGMLKSPDFHASYDSITTKSKGMQKISRISHNIWPYSYQIKKYAKKSISKVTLDCYCDWRGFDCTDTADGNSLVALVIYTIHSVFVNWIRCWPRWCYKTTEPNVSQAAFIHIVKVLYIKVLSIT